MGKRNGEDERGRFNRKWVADDISGCWVWQPALNDSGYGIMSFRGRTQGAHRIGWILSRGEIPPGMHLDHLCRNRKCVNPDHLRIVTPGQNALENSESECARNTAKTHCPQGHQYTEENTYVRSYGPRHPNWKARECRVCRDARHRKSRGLPIKCTPGYSESATENDNA